MKLAEDSFKAGDVDGAMAHFREACQEWLTHWRVASGLSEKHVLRAMTDEELELLENDLMAKMPMTVAYFQRASENAKTLDKREIWEQALLIAQEAEFAWRLSVTICLRRLRGSES
jgi:hypothetical protein